jgi:hypothetical protein
LNAKVALVIGQSREIVVLHQNAKVFCGALAAGMVYAHTKSVSFADPNIVEIAHHSY